MCSQWNGSQVLIVDIQSFLRGHLPFHYIIFTFYPIVCSWHFDFKSYYNYIIPNSIEIIKLILYYNITFNNYFIRKGRTCNPINVTMGVLLAISQSRGTVKVPIILLSTSGIALFQHIIHIKICKRVWTIKIALVHREFFFSLFYSSEHYYKLFTNLIISLI